MQGSETNLIVDCCLAGFWPRLGEQSRLPTAGTDLQTRGFNPRGLAGALSSALRAGSLREQLLADHLCVEPGAAEHWGARCGGENAGLHGWQRPSAHPIHEPDLLGLQGGELIGFFAIFGGGGGGSN